MSVLFWRHVLLYWRLAHQPGPWQGHFRGMLYTLLLREWKGGNCHPLKAWLIECVCRAFFSPKQRRRA